MIGFKPISNPKMILCGFHHSSFRLSTLSCRNPMTLKWTSLRFVWNLCSIHMLNCVGTFYKSWLDLQPVLFIGYVEHRLFFLLDCQREDNYTNASCVLRGVRNWNRGRKNGFPGCCQSNSSFLLSRFRLVTASSQKICKYSYTCMPSRGISFMLTFYKNYLTKI